MADVAKPKPPAAIDYGMPNQTLYVRNLNEKINIKALKHGLRSVFSSYGDIVDVMVRKSVRMRGQAFILFRDLASSERALRLNGFPLFNKTLEVRYARQVSDVTARATGIYEEMKRKRKAMAQENESLYQAIKKKCTENGVAGMEKAAAAKLQSANPYAYYGAMYGMPMSAPTAATAAPAPHVPDELLPPHNILFVQNIPEDADSLALEGLFKGYPGFKEVRTVTGRHDIAFVEYENEFVATAAKEALNGHQLTPDAPLIKVTFGRK